MTFPTGGTTEITFFLVGCHLMKGHDPVATDHGMRHVRIQAAKFATYQIILYRPRHDEAVIGCCSYTVCVFKSNNNDRDSGC